MSAHESWLDYMARRNAATLASAQAIYDNAAPVDMSDDEAELRGSLENIVAESGRAERAADNGDLSAARDILISAARDVLRGLAA